MVTEAAFVIKACMPCFVVGPSALIFEGIMHISGYGQITNQSLKPLFSGKNAQLGAQSPIQKPGTNQDGRLFFGEKMHNIDLTPAENRLAGLLRTEFSQRFSLAEVRVLELLRQGLSDRDISRRTNISEMNVKSHVKKIRLKLNVENRTAAAVLLNQKLRDLQSSGGEGSMPFTVHELEELPGYSAIRDDKGFSFAEWLRNQFDLSFSGKGEGKKDLTLIHTNVAECLKAKLPNSNFTPAEIRVVELLGQDISYEEIGQKLNMVESTVKTHVKAIFKELGVNNRTAAAVFIRSLEGLSSSARVPLHSFFLKSSNGINGYGTILGGEKGRRLLGRSKPDENGNIMVDIKPEDVPDLLFEEVGGSPDIITIRHWKDGFNLFSQLMQQIGK